MRKIYLLLAVSIFFSFVFFPTTTLGAVKDKSSPTVKYTDPKSSTLNFETNKAIKVFFNEKIKKGTNFEKIVLADKSGKNVSIKLSVNSNCLTVVPTTSLVNNTDYILKIPKGSVKDLSNNILLKPFNLSFKTRTREQKPDITPPTTTGSAITTPAITAPAITVPAITTQAPYAILITSSSAISLLNNVTSSDGLKVYIYSGKKYVEANDIQAKYSTNCLIDFQIADHTVMIYGTSQVILSGNNKTKPLLINPLYVGDLNFNEHLYSLFELDYYESTIRPILASIKK